MTGGGLSSSLHMDLRWNQTRETMLPGGTLSSRRKAGGAAGCGEMGRPHTPGRAPRGDLHLLSPGTVGSAQSHPPICQKYHSVNCSLHPSQEFTPTLAGPSTLQARHLELKGAVPGSVEAGRMGATGGPPGGREGR